MWIFTGLLLGSIVTSTHDTREACEGRAVLLREKGVVGECVSNLKITIYGGGGSSVWRPTILGN